MGDAQITFRVDSSLKEEAQHLVDIGKYHNLTDFIQQAMREKLDRDRVDEKTRLKQMLLDLVRSDKEVQSVIEEFCTTPGSVF